MAGNVIAGLAEAWKQWQPNHCLQAISTCVLIACRLRLAHWVTGKAVLPQILACESKKHFCDIFTGGDLAKW